MVRQRIVDHAPPCDSIVIGTGQVESMLGKDIGRRVVDDLAEPALYEHRGVSIDRTRPAPIGERTCLYHFVYFKGMGAGRSVVAVVFAQAIDIAIIVHAIESAAGKTRLAVVQPCKQTPVIGDFKRGNANLLFLPQAEILAYKRIPIPLQPRFD